MKLSVVISIGLGMGFFLNPSFASQEHQHQPTPSTKIEVPLERPAVTLPGIESPEIKRLKETVGKYFTAWTQKDFKTMHSLEDWTGGEKFNYVDYLQSFSVDFTIHTWEITKISSEPDNRYQVLVWITHNPPQNILAHLPKGKTITVRSTLPKLWEKKGDKFVHLFHIEHQKMMEEFSVVNHK
jgi:hypothetical protein